MDGLEKALRTATPIEEQPMKSTILAAALAACVFAVGSAILLRGGRAPVDDTEARIALRDVRDRLGDLAADVGRLAERLDEIEKRAAQQLRAAPDRSSDGAGSAAPASAHAAGADPAAPGPSLSTAMAREALAAGDPATADDLRRFVAEVVREDREETQRRQQEDAQARMRQWRELQEGPYGGYNYRVNSLAAKLGLTDAQKAYYHGLLEEYEPRFRDLRKDVKWTDAEVREAYQRDLDQLQRHLENAVKLGLDPSQRAEYESLPAWERGAGGGARVLVSGGEASADVMTVSAPGGGVLGGVMEVKTAVGSPGEGEKASGTAVRVLLGGPDAPEASTPGQER